MQSINVVVINPVFMTVLFGTALACLAAIVGALVDWDAAYGPYLLAGGAVYLLGTIGVTIDRQRAAQQRPGAARSRERRGGRPVGALPGRVDRVEPRPDGRVADRARARDRSAVRELTCADTSHMAGPKVIVAARTAASGDDAVAKLRAERIDADAIVLDVESVASVRAAARRVHDSHGRLDVLINNAGILPEATEGGGNGPMDLKLFRRTFETNLFGAVTVVQEFLPSLRRSDAGRIVNVRPRWARSRSSSIPIRPTTAWSCPPTRPSPLGDTPIKVNAVCPGWLQTDLGGPAKPGGRADHGRRGRADRGGDGEPSGGRADGPVRRSRRADRLETIPSADDLTKCRRCRTRAPAGCVWSAGARVKRSRSSSTDASGTHGRLTRPPAWWECRGHEQARVRELLRPRRGPARGERRRPTERLPRRPPQRQRRRSASRGWGRRG